MGAAKERLEKEVAERKKLEQKLRKESNELARFNRLAVGRELKWPPARLRLAYEKVCQEKKPLH